MTAETSNKPFRLRAWWTPRESALGMIALAAIVVLAAALRFASLGALGAANHYYTAAGLLAALAGGPFSRGAGDMQVTLYDCHG